MSIEKAHLASVSRRSVLFGTTTGLGAIALQAGILSPKPQHHEAKAKRCIFLLMEGGPSHIDTFDPKPALRRLHLTEYVNNDRFGAAMDQGKRYFVQSPFEFRRAGQSGLEICTEFEQLATCADDLCVYRGARAENVNHTNALFHLNTGNQFGGDPAMGAWTAYGLGTENQNVPAFIVLPDIAYPQGGAANWSNGYLPAHYQGAALRATGAPVLDMNPAVGVSPSLQRAELDLLASENRLHRAAHPQHKDLDARIESYELAFRMQAEMPGLLSIERETEQTRREYGIDDPIAGNFGRRCLLARRLVASGVRFVQVIAGGWDSHEGIALAHKNRMRAVDRPIAALLKDLKRRGLLDSTLVVWAGEFGRTPDNAVRRGGQQTFGRDHNVSAMTMWFAGGGVNAGRVIGATDETGAKAVETVHPLKDVHVTMLHLLGLDDVRLTYFHAGRNKQLSQTGGQVIRPLLA